MLRAAWGRRSAAGAERAGAGGAGGPGLAPYVRNAREWAGSGFASVRDECGEEYAGPTRACCVGRSIYIFKSVIYIFIYNYKKKCTKNIY